MIHLNAAVLTRALCHGTRYVDLNSTQIMAMSCDNVISETIIIMHNVTKSHEVIFHFGGQSGLESNR
jgi:hypothetical protein